MTRTLLIDGDIFAYQVAAAEEKTVEFDGMFTLTADAEQGKTNLDLALAGIKARLRADRLAVAITPTNDPDNFRRAILPTYKQHREGARRPMILETLKAHLVAAHGAKTKPTLEADDLLGIWATNPKLFPGEKIVVTEDKDLKTIPGLHFNPAKDDDIREIGEDLANAYHLLQTLTGDKADGYAGCPGIGVERADRALTAMQGWEPYDHPFKSGPRKGSSERRWRPVPMPSDWAVVVSHFVRAGLTEADALQQAQVARICRHSDFNYQTQRPIPWHP